MAEQVVCKCGHSVDVHDDGVGACLGVYYREGSDSPHVCKCTHFEPFSNEDKRADWSDAMERVTGAELDIVGRVVRVLVEGLIELRNS